MTSLPVKMNSWLAKLSLSVCCLWMGGTASLAQYQAQPEYMEPAQQWGGTLLQPVVPYQPGSLLLDPNDPAAPVMLDEMMCQPDCQPVELPATVVPVQPAQPQLPPGTRKGMFQKAFFNAAWLPAFEDDGLGVSHLEGGIMLGFPFLRPQTPLLVTPQFGVYYLDGPISPDLPARLYDAEVDFRHLRRFGDGPWAMDAAVTVGYYSDFEKGSSDAVRVSGRAIGVYEGTPGTKWLFGVVYVNRAGWRLFPAIGVMHENPEAGTRWDLVFPRPRFSWRLPGGIPGSGDERWVYLGGEFGGGIWTIQQPVTLVEDELTYSDFRLLVGYERKIIGGLTRRFEAGYVFGRELEFASATPDVDLEDSLFLRMGVRY